MSDSKINIKNKKASFQYEFVDKLVAGVVLTGTEIKSIRNGQANINDSFCVILKEELYVRGMHISEYKDGSYNNHEPKRERKLLINKHELSKWDSKVKEKGLTIVPTKLFINGKGLAKLEIALCRGKKLFDKREDLKQKDAKREMSRVKAGRF